jgi:hypothetical protein
MAPQEIDRYLAAVGEPERTTLEELRRSILAVIPDAEQRPTGCQHSRWGAKLSLASLRSRTI